MADFLVQRVRSPSGISGMENIEISSSLLMLTHFFGKNKFYENSVPEIGEKKELNANILKLERSKTKEENKDDLYFF